jgi:hypothetical protein
VASVAALARRIELLTEDLNHGQDYSGVRTVNPFLKALQLGGNGPSGVSSALADGIEGKQRFGAEAFRNVVSTSSMA